MKGGYKVKTTVSRVEHGDVISPIILTVINYNTASYS